MNATAQTPTIDSKQTRTRSYARDYDYQAGTVAIKTEKGQSVTLDIASMPANVVTAFALAAMADWAVNQANEAVKGGITAEEGLVIIANQFDKARAGEVSFRAGAAAGGGESIGVCLLIGRALAELGRSALTHKGVRHTFASATEAGAILRALWDDTAENTVDPHKLTGRQFVSMVKAMPEVAAKLAEYRPKVDKSSVIAGALE